MKIYFFRINIISKVDDTIVLCVLVLVFVWCGSFVWSGEQESQELEKKQAWYQQNQVSMGKEDEEEYLTYCKEAIFRIHILDLRLTRSVSQE